MTKDQAWIQSHFEELVKAYSGRYIAVMNEAVIASGASLKDVDAIARKRFPKATPSILRVPKEQEITCVL